MNPAEDTIQAFPDGRQAQRKRQEPEQEDAVQVMGSINRAFVSDETDDFARQV